MRPMWFNYPTGAGVNEIDDQFQLGSNLIVRPVFEKDAESVKVWLPAGEVWYYAFSGTGIVGTGARVEVPMTLDTFGLFVRGGSVIPMLRGDKEGVRSSKDLEGSKVDLSVYLDEEGKAKGFLFLSDGITTKYEQGDYSLFELEWDGKEIKYALKHGPDSDFSELIG
eukprot:CAMPEP_0202979876 /NCGR_PEP_ID=MMETSP1396-20130829/85909_1 /ASSEMBLY_ACC=CAM_ASM_000872 /TAXON_ID= /ORGANISM="Pseudokeronopsis sp., Strain Brazil" /LENGTH=166 /DNA_ID=CAMNT_0049719511 /DNA_START=2275 /DNA_END=2771 /DNA_ORIENTATION=-